MKKDLCVSVKLSLFLFKIQKLNEKGIMGKERFKLMPAVWVLLMRGNKILLLKRQNTGWKDGEYGLPAGKVDGKETIIQAAIREAYEEVGVKLKKEYLKVAHALHKRNEDLSESIDFGIKVTQWEGEPKIMEPEKCAEICWFPIDDLPPNTIDCLKHVIPLVLKNIFYSEYGWD